MVIWSLQVAIRGTVSLTAYKTQLKNARHRLNEAPRRRILQMGQPFSERVWDGVPGGRLSDGKRPGEGAGG